jgi:glycerate-2-kinase
MIRAGIDAVRPAKLLPKILDNPSSPEFRAWLNAPSRHLLCIGKASLAAADILLSRLAITDHFIICTPNPEYDLSRFNVHTASHPIPDERSLSAAAKLLDWLTALPENANLLVVLSGGASALMVYPLPGISLASKISVNDLLIRSGASIHEMNAVRKHLSQVKGGQLGKVVSRFRTLVFVISDVIGDDLSTIGSGPFFTDPTTFHDAKAILYRFGLWDSVPAEVRKTLEDGIAGQIPETPKPGTLQIPHFIIASNQVAVNAAAAKAQELGYRPILGDPVSGFVDVCAARLADSILNSPAGCALILGGEVTVKLTGDGIGGRNQHLVLLLSEKLSRSNRLFAAAGTDGIDGNSPAAGAWTDGTTLERAEKKRLNFKQYLQSFDSFHFFQQLDQSIITGPTGTNVMDLYLGLGG